MSDNGYVDVYSPLLAASFGAGAVALLCGWFRLVLPALVTAILAGALLTGSIVSHWRFGHSRANPLTPGEFLLLHPAVAVAFGLAVLALLLAWLRQK